MSLRVQSISASARLPIGKPDGSYEIYSGEEKRIPVSSITPVATHIAIGIPKGHLALIQSCSLVARYNIETTTYSSCCEQEFRSRDGESKNPHLILYLRNYGKVDHIIHVGDVIGLLILVHISELPVRDVPDINVAETIVQPFEDRTTVQAKIGVLPKTVMGWFQRVYRENPTATIDEYCSSDPEALTWITDKISEFKNSDAYISAQTKRLQLESVQAWHLVNAYPDIMSKIQENYEAQRRMVESAIVVQKDKKDKKDKGKEKAESSTSSRPVSDEEEEEPSRPTRPRGRPTRRPASDEEFDPGSWLEGGSDDNDDLEDY